MCGICLWCRCDRAGVSGEAPEEVRERGVQDLGLFRCRPWPVPGMLMVIVVGRCRSVSSASCAGTKLDGARTTRVGARDLPHSCRKEAGPAGRQPAPRGRPAGPARRPRPARPVQAVAARRVVVAVRRARAAQHEHVLRPRPCRLPTVSVERRLDRHGGVPADDDAHRLAPGVRAAPACPPGRRRDRTRRSRSHAAHGGGRGERAGGPRLGRRHADGVLRAHPGQTVERRRRWLASTVW